MARPTMEWSDGFDAEAFYFEQMSKPSYDSYYDEEN